MLKYCSTFAVQQAVSWCSSVSTLRFLLISACVQEMMKAACWRGSLHWLMAGVCLERFYHSKFDGFLHFILSFLVTRQTSLPKGRCFTWCLNNCEADEDFSSACWISVCTSACNTAFQILKFGPSLGNVFLSDREAFKYLYWNKCKILC